MSSPLQVGGSMAAGVILSLLAVLGGMSSITPGANAEESSAEVVLYDAP